MNPTLITWLIISLGFLNLVSLAAVVGLSIKVSDMLTPRYIQTICERYK